MLILTFRINITSTFRMAFLAVYILVSLGMYSVAGLNIPKGYVLDVKAVCGGTSKGVTKIKLLTDLDVHIEGECSDAYIAQFNTLNYVEWNLDVHYSGDSKKQCIMEKKKLSSTYWVILSVSWAEPGEIMLNHDLLQITCTLDNYGKGISKVETVKPGLLGPRELQSHMGGRATSSFQLKLTDINGRGLPKNVPLGRKVQLRAEMLVSALPGAKDEVGLRAVSCAAVGGKSSYKILRGGCGDGLILPRESGFTTTGKITKSPIFSAFRLAKSRSVSFLCNFTTCKSNCDGDSCKIETRRRRDGHEFDVNQVMIPLHVNLHVRSADNPETEEIDPCQIPGLTMEGCQTPHQHLKTDFPVGATTFMMTVMVLFPVLLIVGIIVFLCCAKNKNSYGMTEVVKTCPS